MRYLPLWIVGHIIGRWIVSCDNFHQLENIETLAASIANEKHPCNQVEAFKENIAYWVNMQKLYLQFGISKIPQL